MTKKEIQHASPHCACTKGGSFGLGLMWWEPRPQTAPPSAQVWMDLILRKVDLYVNKEILSSRHSSRGPSLCGRLAP